MAAFEEGGAGEGEPLVALLPPNRARKAAAFARASATALLMSELVAGAAPPLETGLGDPLFERDLFDAESSSSGCGLFSTLFSVSAMKLGIKDSLRRCFDVSVLLQPKKHSGPRSENVR